MAEVFKCVAIETATEHCSVAAGDGRQREVIHLTSARNSSGEVYAAIQDVMDRASMDITDLNCVAFGCGPGSFTGLRIAAGAAQALAYSRGIPVCRVSTLAAMALTAARMHGLELVAPCLDARRGEAYLGMYRYEKVTSVDFERDQVEALQPDQLLAPEEIQLPTQHAGWLAAGPGWDVWPEVTARNAVATKIVAAEIWPDAGAVLDLAQSEFSAGNTVAAADALPNYIRNKVTG